MRPELVRVEIRFVALVINNNNNNNNDIYLTSVVNLGCTNSTSTIDDLKAETLGRLQTMVGKRTQIVQFSTNV